MQTIRWFASVLFVFFAFAFVRAEETAELTMAVRCYSKVAQSQESRYRTQELFHKKYVISAEVTGKDSKTTTNKKEVEVITEEDRKNGAGYMTIPLWKGAIPTGESALTLPITIRQTDPEGRTLEVGKVTAHLQRKKGALDVCWIAHTNSRPQYWSLPGPEQSNSDHILFVRHSGVECGIHFLATCPQEVERAKAFLESEAEFIKRLEQTLKNETSRQVLQSGQSDAFGQNPQVRLLFGRMEANVLSNVGVTGSVQSARIFALYTLKEKGEEVLKLEFPNRKDVVAVEDMVELRQVLRDDIAAKVKKVNPQGSVEFTKFLLLPAWEGLKGEPWSSGLILGSSKE